MIEGKRNTEYSVTLWQKSTSTGRNIIKVPLQIKFDGSTKSVTLQERQKARWITKSRNRRPIPLVVGKVAEILD